MEKTAQNVLTFLSNILKVTFFVTIQISTNKPSIGSVVFKIAPVILRKYLDTKAHILERGIDNSPGISLTAQT